MVRFFIVFSLCVCLAACSGTWRTYQDMADYARTDIADETYTLADITASSSELAYARLGQQPQQTLRLSSSTDDREKWQSSHQSIFTLQYGRVVKTYGLANDLLYSEQSDVDPLSSLYQHKQQFQRLTDWALKNESGFPQSFAYQHSTNETVEWQGQSLATRKVTEQVTFADGSTALNYFWFSLKQPMLVKSEQQLAPFGPRVTMTYVSRITRLQ